MNRTTRGFTLIEVLVSIIIVAVGLLGVAKLQAAAISNSKLSGTRSLVAIAASSLAASMQSNRAFWTSSNAPNLTVNMDTVHINSGVLPVTGNQDCTQTCTPDQQAAYDMLAWQNNLAQHIAGFQNAYVTTTPSPNAPTHYQIVVTWAEKSIAINKSTTFQGQASDMVQSLTLYVEL